MVDDQGFRAGVGIVILNQEGQVFWARRIGRNGWQFPQGGIQEGETPEQAMYRELHEEVGLNPEDVRVITKSQGWISYRLPKPFIRRHMKPICLGQKQRWFLLELVGSEEHINFDRTDSPEFDSWTWVDYWYPLGQIVAFKRDVYKSVLNEFSSWVS